MAQEAPPTVTIRSHATLPVDPRTAFDLFTRGVEEWCAPGSKLEPVAGTDAKFVFFARGLGPTVAPGEGKVLSVEEGSAIVFTYGEAGTERMPPGSTTVRVTFSADGNGTRMDVAHEVPATEPLAPPSVDVPQGPAAMASVVWQVFMAWIHRALRVRAEEQRRVALEAWIGAWCAPRQAGERRVDLSHVVTEDALLLDFDAGFHRGRGVFGDHVHRVRDALPPGFTVRVAGEPRMWMAHAFVALEAVAPSNEVVAGSDQLLRFAEDGKLALVEIAGWQR